MAQYPIPQFIEEEGKIVFFLTFKQFFLLVGGFVACILLFMNLPFLLFAIASVIIMGTVCAIAFLKIENEPVLKALFHYLQFSTDDKNYVWKKEDYQMQYQLPGKEEPIKNAETVQKQIPTLKTTTRSRLGEIKKSIELKR